MARYRFHATNGYECVFDAHGKDIRVPERLVRQADKVAQEVMSNLADREDWSEWHVTVHDLNGRRVLVKPFVSGAVDLRAFTPEQARSGSEKVSTRPDVPYGAAACPT
ncbi:hypothetical protein Mchl_4095 [Methylorubrum extorquens CM4]|uniref:DUF6894 domain-containing protein n=1 Tax=Methylorubrum extorquens (strain CM4 / NCIMB 13688) TaxID=440085 RepID=B7KZW2_METC4|nr:hypothetical protein Mchl_4095 [Methylorubrum extorquens CM4]